MRGIDHDGVPSAPERAHDVTSHRRYGVDAMNAELQRHCLHDAIGNHGWSTDLSVMETKSVVALMRTVDGCEAFRLVPWPPVREYHVPIARQHPVWMNPMELPPVQFERRTYRLKTIEREAHHMLMRAVYEEVL